MRTENIALVFLLCVAGGCVSAMKSTPSPEAGLTVDASVDQASYRPGQAVVCTVSVANRGTTAVTVPPLNCVTLRFWYGPTGTDTCFRRNPVVSPKEGPGENAVLLPGTSIDRRFLLTQLTEKEGKYAFHILYSPGIPGDALKAATIAPAVSFDVAGPVAFTRDSRGLVSKEDAIRVAREKAGTRVSGGNARLVSNEAGLPDWWVNVDGGKKSFFVNACTGVVVADARPFSNKTEPGKR